MSTIHLLTHVNRLQTYRVYLVQRYTLYLPVQNMSDTASTKSTHDILTNRLQINIISIVIGALVIGVFISIVDTLRAWCAAILDKGGETSEGETNNTRYRVAIRRSVSTFVIFLFAIFLGILLITWARGVGLV